MATKDRVPADIIEDPAASYWLKEAVCQLNKRDPVDALRDVEVLLEVFKNRYYYVTGRKP